MQKNEFTFLPAYAPIFHSDKTYFLISGGRGSGKSTQIAAYFIMKLFQPEYFRGIVARYTLRSITNSIYRDILDLIDKWGVKNHLVVTGDEIRNPTNGNMVITHAMKVGEGTMSAKSKGLSNVTHLLIDEFTELQEEEEYIKLIDSFRTKGAERKIFLCFNPTSKNHWIFKRFYLPDSTPHPKWQEDHCFLHTTYKDNLENLDPTKIKEWERMQERDPDYYNHHLLGLWRDVGSGQVYKNWDWHYFVPDPEAEEVLGLDFGFAHDPTALVSVKKRGNKLWIKELIYQTGLTIDDLHRAMLKANISQRSVIVADSADPRSIETLRRLGWRNIRPAVKGPDSIRAGIDTINSYEVHADAMSFNLRLEYDNYYYREGTDKPIDNYNHILDGVRYAVGTQLQIGSSSGYLIMGARKKSEFDLLSF
nr:MAG: terminase large subunit [Caudoviricetes sp.]